MNPPCGLSYVATGRAMRCLTIRTDKRCKQVAACKAHKSVAPAREIGNRSRYRR